MTEMETVTRKWGNSLGITIPRDLVQKEHLHQNQKVVVEIKTVVDITRIRGLGTFSKSTQQLKDEMRAGWK